MSMRREFIKPRRGALLTRDMNLPATRALTAGTFQEIGRHTITPGRALAIGYGVFSSQSDAEGRIRIDIRDAAAAPGAALAGRVRITLRTALDEVDRVAFEADAAILRSGADNRSLQVPLPERDPIITEHKSIVLEFNPDVAVTVGAANTFISIDTTPHEAKDIYS